MGPGAHFLSTRARLLRALVALSLLAGAGACTKPPAALPDLTGTWLPDPSRAEPWPDLPLTDVAQRAKDSFDATQQDPTSFCMPLGTPRNMLQTQYPLEIIQTPERVLLVLQPNLANAEVRRIPLDAPLPDMPEPSWAGTSRGHWEGSTLVVETRGLRPDAPVSGDGVTHSGELRVIERFTLSSDAAQGRVLVDEIELHDPQAFRAVLKTRRTYVWAPQAQPRESSCIELQWIDKLWRDRLREHADSARAGARR